MADFKDASGSDPDVDPDSPPTEEELLRARALADALRAPAPPPGASSEDAAFLRAVALARTDRPLAPDVHARIIEEALATARERRGGRVIRVVFGASLFLAAAAVLLLVLGRPRPSPPSAQLQRSRSTQELFSEPFRPGEASARIDRIAMARSSDLRDNRFAAWGVR